MLQGILIHCKINGDFVTLFFLTWETSFLGFHFQDEIVFDNTNFDHNFDCAWIYLGFTMS